MNRRMYALGRLEPGRMNQTEAEYSGAMETRQRAGEIAWHLFAGVKLRLADNTFYSPYFVVMRSDGRMEMREVKGFWTDDARVKVKVAADFNWRKRVNTEWMNAITVIADIARGAALAGCTTNGLMRREHVIRCFVRKAERESLERLAEKHGMTINTVSAHAKKVSHWLLGKACGQRRGRAKGAPFH